MVGVGWCLRGSMSRIPFIRESQTKIPKYLSFPTTPSFTTTPSFSSVSVRCRRAFSFKRRLTDTCVLGNLPKVGTGFVGIHASLREIPEGDEKYSRCRSLFFYHSRMTGIYNSSFSSVSVRCRRAFSFSGGLPDTYDLGNLPKIGTGFVGIHGNLREIPEGEENMVAYRLPIFYRSRMTGLWGLPIFYRSRMTTI